MKDVIEQVNKQFKDPVSIYCPSRYSLNFVIYLFPIKGSILLHLIGLCPLSGLDYICLRLYPRVPFPL